MLLKVGSEDAVSASMFAAETAFAEIDGSDRELATHDPMAELIAQNEELRAQLQHRETELGIQVAKARQEGRREAAAEHVRNDERLIAEVSAALVSARESFENALLQSTQALASQLAAAALGQFVETQIDDNEWLLRVIKHRLLALEAATVITIALPESYRSLADLLGDFDKTKLEFDPALSAGSARIDLVMGNVPIRVGDGLARLLRVLDAQSETHG